MLAELYRQLRGQIDRHRLRSLELRGDLRRSIEEHRAIFWAARTGDVERAVHLASDHIRVPRSSFSSRTTSWRQRMGGRVSAELEFGVNLNNREPLIAPDYDLQMLLDLSEVVEASGFDSVWVGDSLFSKPRYEPIACSPPSRSAPRGSSSARPAWSRRRATRSTSRSSGRRSTSSQAAARSSAAGQGNPEEGVRREFEALGLDYERRASIFEEGLAVLRELWTTGTVTFHGRYFDYDDIGFYSGTEMGPLMPLQKPPPIWVVSNPRLKGDAAPEAMRAPARGGLPPDRVATATVG